MYVFTKKLIGLMQICGVTYPHQPNQIFVCHFVTEFKFTDLRGEKVAGKVTDGLCKKVFDALPMISTVSLKTLHRVPRVE